MMHFRYMLHDGKSESGSARFSGTALIGPEEPLKNTLLIFGRYADAVVSYHQPVRHGNPHVSALLIIADCIVAQVIKQFFDQVFVRADHKRRSGQGKKHLMPGRDRFHHRHAPGRQFIQINRFKSELVFRHIIQL